VGALRLALLALALTMALVHSTQQLMSNSELPQLIGMTKTKKANQLMCQRLALVFPTILFRK
jgi:hypothetical protein